MERDKILEKLVPGLGMSRNHSTFEERIELVNLFKKFNLSMSSGVDKDYLVHLPRMSLYITSGKALYFTRSISDVKHLSLKQWKEDIFGIKEIKQFDNSTSCNNTFLDQQLKTINN